MIIGIYMCMYAHMYMYMYMSSASGLLCKFNTLRVYIQNVPVYGGNTRTCVSTCARVAGIHGDVLNVHTEAC